MCLFDFDEYRMHLYVTFYSEARNIYLHICKVTQKSVIRTQMCLKDTQKRALEFGFFKKQFWSFKQIFQDV